MSVVKKFFRDLGEFAIDIQDWEILDQGITVLWGPSGAGKSTILNGLLGLDPRAEVEWMWQQKNLAAQTPTKRNLGVVFQDLGLFPHMSAEENILFPVHRKRHPHWQQDFQWLVEVMELSALLKSPVHKLSGGEKQRIALVRSLIYRPQMLLLDEPFSSLDERLRTKARGMVQKASEHFKCPVLLVTHDRQDVQALAQRVCQIEKGKILQVTETL